MTTIFPLKSLLYFHLRVIGVVLRLADVLVADNYNRSRTSMQFLYVKETLFNITIIN